MNRSLSSFANETTRTIREWFSTVINTLMSAKGEKYRKVAPEQNEETCSIIVTEIKERKKSSKSPLSLISLPLPFENDATYASKLLASLKATPMRKSSSISLCSNETIVNIANRRHIDMPRLEIARNLRVDTSFSYCYDESDSVSSSSELSRNSSKICYSKELKNLSCSFSPSSCGSHWRIDDGEIPRRSSATLHGLKEQQEELLLLEHDSVKTEIQQCDIEEMECTTALVTACPSVDNLSPSISPRNHYNNIQNAKWDEFYTETPSCSPIAGLSQKPIQSKSHERN